MNKTKRNLIGQKIEALFAAKKFLPRDWFICNALENVQHRNPQLRQACVDLRDYIHNELGGCNITLRDWLVRRKHMKPTPRNMLDYRCAWVNWMIDDLLKQLRGE